MNRKQLLATSHNQDFNSQVQGLITKDEKFLRRAIEELDNQIEDAEEGFTRAYEISINN